MQGQKKQSKVHLVFIGFVFRRCLISSSTSTQISFTIDSYNNNRTFVHGGRKKDLNVGVGGVQDVYPGITDLGSQHRIYKPWKRNFDKSQLKISPFSSSSGVAGVAEELLSYYELFSVFNFAANPLLLLLPVLSATTGRLLQEYYLNIYNPHSPSLSSGNVSTLLRTIERSSPLVPGQVDGIPV